MVLIAYCIQSCSSVVASWGAALEGTDSNLLETFKFCHGYFYHFEGSWFESSRHRGQGKLSYCIMYPLYSTVFRGFRTRCLQSGSMLNGNKIKVRLSIFLADSIQLPSGCTSPMPPLSYHDQGTLLSSSKHMLLLFWPSPP